MMCRSRHDPRPVAETRLWGELDIAQLPLLHVLCGAALSGPVAHIRLLMADVTFLDCAGLGGLIEMANRANARGCDVTLVDPGEPVMRVLRIAGGTGSLAIHHS